MNAWRRLLSAAALAALLPALSAPAAAQDLPEGFDAHVEEVLRSHGVPGMAISVVKDGAVVHARGYGVRRLGGDEPLDADTIIPTGSTGKAVTAAALAILVDEGRLDWDDKVIDHLPGFRMYDPWVTREMTVRDLLVHRSGLGLGAGDLLMVPRTSRSRADIVRALRHIAPARSFRSGYAYDNVLYVVAGELVAAVAGQDWESFVRERIFRPAGMATAVSHEDDRFATANRAQPHARLDPRLRGLGPQQVLPEREGLGQVAAPAGGLSWSANDFARWMQLQLGHGALPDGRRLWSEAAAREMWTPQVVMPTPQYPVPIADMTPQFAAYAFGWQVQDYRGVKVLQHGGAVFGAIAFVILVPERGIGVSLQMNAEDVGVLRGLGYELLDHLLGLPSRDWVAAFDAWNEQRLAAGLAALEAARAAAPARKASRPSLPNAGYAGEYADAWYGPIAVTERNGRLRMDFRQTPDMAGTMTHWQYDTFRVDWDDASIEPAYATFQLDAAGKVERITMRAVSPLADFSYDYQDLLFRPVPAAGGR